MDAGKSPSGTLGLGHVDLMKLVAEQRKKPIRVVIKLPHAQWEQIPGSL